MRFWFSGFRRRLERALALHQRGEARSDGLKLAAAKTRLKIEWFAREIHPWDRDESETARSERFIVQTMKDTEAAIRRLFASLPEIDTITLAVREPGSENVILAGTVSRPARAPDPRLSVGMRLRDWGVVYYTDGCRFEPLGSSLRQETIEHDDVGVNVRDCGVD